MFSTRPDGADRIDPRLARRQRMHQADDAGRAPHVALHVFHAGGPLDGNAAGVEADALADKATGFSPFLAPFQRITTTRLGCVEPLADSEQRAHAELGHRLYVEHLDIDADPLQLTGAAREFNRKQHVRRLVDEVAGDDDTVNDMRFRREGLLRCGDVANRDRNVGPQGGIVAVFVLRLVAVEFIGAQPHARGDAAA
jgi:hypothetical protein